MTGAEAARPGPLAGVTVVDLSRILAGPTCTQLLGDLGATIIKIENPATGGDDTRQWGPPYMHAPDGTRTDLSAYFMSANRNKLSICLDISSAADQRTIRGLVAGADIFVENFKPGGLAAHGLDAASLLADNPRLVCCSISGFGQTGPNSSKPGYDLLAQGYGGIMSLTGAPDGEPMKVGVGIADVMCGMYATIGILAALRHRDLTGEGQHVDLALVDSQIAWLINEGVNYLTSGAVPERRGNGHPNIVPYQVFETADGHVIVAVGNNSQFRRFSEAIGAGWLADDPAYATNPDRIANRKTLIPIVSDLVRGIGSDALVARLEAARVPAGPVNRLDDVFASDQAKARGMRVDMPHPALGGAAVPLIGNPLKLSRTPVSYRRPPPTADQDRQEVLSMVREVFSPERST